ncbi:DUF1800 domain-containing protein [Candidatus Thiothrix sp. Deng01]|uniref:DUF1800 domain-containing protein n=1 Tax=Candidatus Thiothrix phosphatis TaxID=3112415 RepID=A0ABU6CYA9_9GAMM|nr:DUF1800 domain-containing protein [Candidatus Thiothrix sp. Deng01]MEB4591512.1 DUF1800 domain-containing protein [Candidatus Thiothrix sp. Deng01]
MISTSLDLPDARHLAVRACLGEEWLLMQSWQGASPQTVVRRLLAAEPQMPAKPPTLASWGSWENMLEQGEMAQAREQLNRDKMALKQWWLQHLLHTQTPLAERMVMFWHNHFTTSINKVNQPNLVLQQHQLIRQHALGNFRALLHAIARDPAMLIYLDGAMNYKQHPNENFARELLELFTLGSGHYRESDIKAAACAFTGWTVDRNSNRFLLDAQHHAPNTQPFLGKSGVQDGEQALDALLEHPRTAEHIAEKCWYAFVSTESHDQAQTRQWANAFRSSGYDIKTLLESVLLSEAFWAQQHRGVLIKSPLDLLTGVFRALPWPGVAPSELVKYAEKLGQNPFVPPTPKGWEGGKAWITTQSLLDRYGILFQLTRTLPPTPLPVQSAAQIAQWLLATSPVKALTGDSPQQFLLAAMFDPAYQLK